MMPMLLRIITHGCHRTEALLTGPLGGRALNGTMQHLPVSTPSHFLSIVFSF